MLSFVQPAAAISDDPVRIFQKYLKKAIDDRIECYGLSNSDLEGFVSDYYYDALMNNLRAEKFKFKFPLPGFQRERLLSAISKYICNQMQAINHSKVTDIFAKTIYDFGINAEDSNLKTFNNVVSHGYMISAFESYQKNAVELLGHYKKNLADKVSKSWNQYLHTQRESSPTLFRVFRYFVDMLLILVLAIALQDFSQSEEQLPVGTFIIICLSITRIIQHIQSYRSPTKFDTEYNYTPLEDILENSYRSYQKGLENSQKILAMRNLFTPVLTYKPDVPSNPELDLPSLSFTANDENTVVTSTEKRWRTYQENKTVESKTITPAKSFGLDITDDLGNTYYRFPKKNAFFRYNEEEISELTHQLGNDVPHRVAEAIFRNRTIYAPNYQSVGPKYLGRTEESVNGSIGKIKFKGSDVGRVRLHFGVRYPTAIEATTLECDKNTVVFSPRGLGFKN